MTLEIQVMTWDRHKNVVGLNWLMGSHLSPLDNWISNGNAYINKRFKKTYKDSPHTITKRNDNINMDSTIAGSMNA